jgi:NAD(P)-dependent dehydrogenase (short-subunit alcohol dehydrogenase family)
MGDLDGKVALVTGAAGGIGSETARVLAAAGARLVVTDLAGTGVDEVATALRDGGSEAVAQDADLTDEDSVAALMRAVADTFGRLDVLANVAGATTFTDRDTIVTEVDVEVWDEIMAINVRGPMLTCKHGIPLMTAGGSIVNISSATAFAGDLGNVAYATAKGGLNTLTKYVATVYGPQGIRCNAIAPGIVLTPRAQGTLPPPVQEIFVSNTLVHRLGRPGDIAAVVCFLASDASGYLTGQIIPVDGGHSAHQPHIAQFMALGPPQ